MILKGLKYTAAVIFCLTFFAQHSNAQFKEGAFTQNYNEPGDTLGRRDSVDKLFSFKEFFGGLSHKNKLKIGAMTGGSLVFIGASQIYNKDYWKLPIIYGGLGSLAGTGGYYLHRYNKTHDPKDKRTGTWLLAGAGLLYWGTLLDGAVCFQSDRIPDPGRATIYSMLLPGLGQIYNGELFKVPIYWGCLAGSIHFLTTNHTNYVRFKRIHNEATNPDPAISGEVPISGETAKWYRDVYRRYRDYSIVATVAFYLLQVIDANVFAYMHDFEVDDDITMGIEPAVIAPNNMYALQGNTYPGGHNAIGLRIGITF